MCNIISLTHVADASLPAHSHDVFDQLVEVPDENDEVANIHRYISNSVQYDLFEILMYVNPSDVLCDYHETCQGLIQLRTTSVGDGITL